MKKITKILGLVSFALLVLALADAEAQCAMCKAAVENELKAGSNLGAGLNQGILYLMSIPYIMVSFIAYFWFRKSRKNAAQKRLKIDFPKL